jgi:lipid II:glycine glycyltransferase (peptidoglycan interpeptide bridge formation enzyme)
MPAPQARHRVLDTFKHHSLSLEGDLEKIFSRIHRTSIRHPIKKAMTSGVKVESQTDIGALDRFYELYKRTRKRLGLPVVPILYFRSLWEEFCASGNIMLLSASLNGHWVTSLFLFKYKDRVSAEALGWDEDYRDSSPSSLIWWEAIRLAHSEGYKVFDLGRTDTANVGLMDYKRRWGTEVSDMPIYVIEKSVGAFSKQQAEKNGLVNTIVRNCIRFSPDPLFHAIGRLWYNHFA